MAIKKKAAKPAKKPTNSKKAAPAKKAVAKPIRHAAKKVEKKAAPKKVLKKAAPVAKKPIPAKKVAVKHVDKKVSHPAKKVVIPVKQITPVKHVTSAKPEIKKPALKVPEQKLEPRVIKPVPKPEPKKPVKVIIPEIKTKTVRKYEPTFTKSVLDTPLHENQGPTMRYNDSELNEFRELISKKLEVAKKELAYLQGLITRKDEMGGDNDDARYMTMEDGSMSMEREQLSQMASRQITFIDHLEKAMMRIENKTYGICRVTGKLIDKARLRAVPHATLSIEAKQMMNK
jgi:RNA polymerase-binding transcription factor DksA